MDRIAPFLVEERMVRGTGALMSPLPLPPAAFLVCRIRRPEPQGEAIM